MSEHSANPDAAGFPARRMRRLRRTPALRRMVAETRLSVDDLIAPLFVREGIDEPVPIASLPGVSQHTVASLVAEVATNDYLTGETFTIDGGLTMRIA